MWHRVAFGIAQTLLNWIIRRLHFIVWNSARVKLGHSESTRVELDHSEFYK